MNQFNNNFQQNQIKMILQNPQFKAQIQQMYSLWQGDQQRFIKSMIQNNPQLNNNPIIMSVLSGRVNGEQMFNQMLGQYGLTQQDFMNLLK